MATTCPACGAEATGRFCSQCGTPLHEERICDACGNRIPPGGRFCNMCGEPVGVVAGKVPPQEATLPSEPPPPEPDRTSGNLPWYIAGAALLALIVAIVAPRFGSEDGPSVAAPPLTGPASTGLPGDPSSVDLGSMTPRDAAIRLFDRVVRTASSGDTAGARAFAPMAIAAYEMVPDKTLDDRYHVAVIHFVDGNYPAARAAADSILAEVPTHLFGLGTAAQAAAAMGDDAAARSYYESLLENFDAEVAAGRGEYEEHPLLLPQLREDAERYLAGGP